MFDPMKWFGRGPYQQVGEDENDDHIEVDQISFTSSCSSGDNDGYVTARTSTLLEKREEQLKDLISFDDGDIMAPGTSDHSLLSPDSPMPSCSSTSCSAPPFPDPKNLKESVIVRQSIFWFNESEVDASKLVLPISNKGRVCRFDNDVDDNQLETMCRTLQISMSLTERSRWLNHLARDPVMSSLVRQLDDEFPTPSTSTAETSTSLEPPDDTTEINGADIDMRPPASSFSSCSGSFQTIITPPETAGRLLDDPTPLLERGLHRTVVPEHPGIQGVEIRRRVNETPSAVCSAIIRQAAETDKPVDRRMVEWMRGFAEVAPTSRKHDKYSFEVPPLTEDWILVVHKQLPLRQGLEAQAWKCAACRQSLHSSNLGDKDTCPRFCDYFGFYFCCLCHGNEKSIIPARVINQWAFAEHPVSDRAMRFLRAVRETPVFRIQQLSPDLLKKNKALRIVVELRKKLKYMEEFIKICVAASSQVFEFGYLSTMFASLDRYLLEQDDLFSLNDLQRVYNKDLLSLLEPLARRAREHILNCKKCRLQAPVCVLCNDMTDRLFQFEERTVSKCQGCGALSHLQKCPRRDVPRDTHCRKCARLKDRRTGNSGLFRGVV
uniref:DUF4206 domain-containing protein n=1 Tax=Caenorhabditis japonica TaxID=281687 RepID=A0A8R1DLP2_CAEJA